MAPIMIIKPFLAKLGATVQEAVRIFPSLGTKENDGEVCLSRAIESMTGVVSVEGPWLPEPSPPRPKYAPRYLTIRMPCRAAVHAGAVYIYDRPPWLFEWLESGPGPIAYLMATTPHSPFIDGMQRHLNDACKLSRAAARSKSQNA